MRFLALLLAVTLSGPSVGALFCDLACAAKHEVSQGAAGACHEHGTDAINSTRLAAGHQCHTLVSSPQSILTATAPSASAPAVVTVDALTPSASAPTLARAVAGLDGTPHAPPPSAIPLRI